MSARVLVVDDDDDLREVMCEALSAEGYEAVQAEDGQRALARLRERRVDVILLDLMMPNMNGWEFRAEQQRDPALAGIPVIVMTAATDVSRTAELAASAYLQKPVALGALLETVAEVGSK
jgi:CheY-like chemotaxis protein